MRIAHWNNTNKWNNKSSYISFLLFGWNGYHLTGAFQPVLLRFIRFHMKMKSNCAAIRLRLLPADDSKRLITFFSQQLEHLPECQCYTNRINIISDNELCPWSKYVLSCLEARLHIEAKCQRAESANCLKFTIMLRTLHTHEFKSPNKHTIADSAIKPVRMKRVFDNFAFARWTST